MTTYGDNTQTNKQQRERHTTDTDLRRGSERPSPGQKQKSSGEGQRSADELRENVKEVVGKAVAAVAGAAEGVAETMEETELADTAESAVKQVGDMGHRVVKAAREETDNIKAAFKGEETGGEGQEEDDSGTGMKGASSGTGSASSFGDANTSGKRLDHDVHGDDCGCA
jgi:hypothetical protein